MATTTVFVDDAVQGHLPMVCVRTGEPADGLHRIHQTIGGGSPWAFLLVFLGPLGWLVLFAGLLFGGRSRQLLVRLPYSHDGLRWEQGQFRAAVLSGLAMVVGAIALVVALTGPAPRSQVRETVILLVAGATVCAFVATFALGIRYSFGRPGIELDASGRWVTLRGVHPNFVRAVGDRSVRETVDRL